MDTEKAISEIISCLRQGAELRNRVAQECVGRIVEASALLVSCVFGLEARFCFFGNGGSAADAQHLAAEFVGRFVRERAGNDYGFEQVFARQVQALGMSA